MPVRRRSPDRPPSRDRLQVTGTGLPPGLELLHGRRCGRARLRLAGVRPMRRTGWHVFAVYVDGSRRPAPAIRGIYSVGGKGVAPWIEAEYHPEVAATTHQTAVAVGRGLLRALAAVIAPGGHVMIEYESPAHRETYEAIRVGVPPIATPLGADLYRCGFTGGFKAWYFAEGGHEGPPKLQASRAPDVRACRAVARRLAAELRAFLAAPSPVGEIGARARTRARSLLPVVQYAVGRRSNRGHRGTRAGARNRTAEVKRRARQRGRPSA